MGRKADLMFSLAGFLTDTYVCVGQSGDEFVVVVMLKKKGLADKGVGYSCEQSFECQWNSLCTLITNWACRGTNSSTCRVDAE